MGVMLRIVGIVLAILLLASPACATQILSLAITTALTAQTSPVLQYRSGAVPSHATIEASFTYGSGGTSADAWVQTSVDGGNTWIDVVDFHFTTSTANAVCNLNAQTAVITIYTPTDGTLSANTTKDGIIGPQWRVKYTTVGTYGGGTTLVLNLTGGGQLEP
jgi:hypothetical protein